MTAGSLAGIGLLDLATLSVVRALAFRLAPENLHRELTAVPDDANAAAPPRAVEILTCTIAFDAIDDPALSDAGSAAGGRGLHPRLAALESICFPDRTLAARPLNLLTFGADRIVPVRLTALTIDEQAFDARLQPVRATVRLVMEAIPFDRLDASARSVALLQPKNEVLARLGDDGAAGIRLPAGRLALVP